MKATHCIYRRKALVLALTGAFAFGAGTSASAIDQDL